MTFEEAMKRSNSEPIGLTTDDAGNLYVTPIGSSGGLPVLASAVGANIALASSPTNWSGTFAVTVNVHTALGRNSGGGWIACDGPGKLRVGLSADGSTGAITTDGATSSVLVVAAGEVLDLPAGINIMKIDADQNATAYRYEVA